MSEETEKTNAVLSAEIGGLKEVVDIRLKGVEATLVRMEQANLVTITTWATKEKIQDDKIDILISAKTKAEGQISTLKILWPIVVLIIGIVQAVIFHYWK